MARSMTGFARQLQQDSWGALSCEIRSVNYRYLELSIRLPESLRLMETEIREQLRQHLHRGKIEVNFQLSLCETSERGLAVNESLLATLMDAIDRLREKHSHIAETDPLRLLQWPGVLEQAKIDGEIIQQSVKNLLQQALSALVAHRQREGNILQKHIEDRLQNLNELCIQIKKIVPTVLSRQEQNLRQRLEKFSGELDQQRLEQEIVLLANKADISEELDRLTSHVDEVWHILQQTSASGRRLDFMMQELNREANTLSSKSLSSEITKAAVMIKVLIEQMREQIQNIE